jgi:hypothetical protein
MFFSFRIRSVCGIAPRQNYTANTIKNPQDSKKNVIKLEKIFKFALISLYNLLKLKVLLIKDTALFMKAEAKLKYQKLRGMK